MTGFADAVEQTEQYCQETWEETRILSKVSRWNDTSSVASQQVAELLRDPPAAARLTRPDPRTGESPSPELLARLQEAAAAWRGGGRRVLATL